MGIEAKNITRKFLKKYNIDNCINEFASACGLYSTVLDINGKILVDPTGPKTYLGEFYVTVTNPKYFKLYTDVVSCIVDTGESMYSEIDDGNPDTRVAAAPLFVDGTFVATWILYAHTKTQNQKLFKAFDSFSSMAKSLSAIIAGLYKGSVSISEDKIVRAELEFERECKELTDEIIDTVLEGDKGDLSSFYERVGKLLNVDYIVYYEVDEELPGHMILNDYWAKEGKGRKAERTFGWEKDHYSLEFAKQIKRKGLIIDKNNMTNQMRVEVFRGNAKAVMVFPVFLKGHYHGRMIFIENTKERVWNDAEISFAKQITEIVSRFVTVQLHVDEVEEGWQIIRSMAESIPEMVLVRSIHSGKVIYANHAFKRIMGPDVEGRDVNRLIPLQEVYDEKSMTPFEPKETHYQRYIDELGGIYDVTENYHRWGSHDIVSVIVLASAR